MYSNALKRFWISFESIFKYLYFSTSDINNLRYTGDITLMAESEGTLKRHLMKVKEESEKAGFKFNIQKMEFTISSPITSWQIEGKKVEAMTDFIFLGSKITVEGDCRHEIKRPLLLGRIVMTNLDSMLKSRDITLPAKVHLVQAMFFFPVVMYGCESWTIKKLSDEEFMLLNCGIGEDS